MAESCCCGPTLPLAEETIESTALVLILLGMQGLANGGHNLIAELSDPDIKSRARQSRENVVKIVVESLRRYPPSSPIMMPLYIPGQGFKVFVAPWPLGCGENAGCPAILVKCCLDKRRG